MSSRPSLAAALCIITLSLSSALLHNVSVKRRRVPMSSFRRQLFVHYAKEDGEDDGVSSRLVQQEQLFEELSRKNAETIAALSISERTKRAMLAEVVEDELFSVAEQMVDLVQKNDAQSNGVEWYEEQVKELKTRNSFLQKQYSDLVSGRPSSLLNSVDSVTTSVDGDKKDRPLG